MDSSIKNTVSYCAGRIAHFTNGDKVEIEKILFLALEENGYADVSKAFEIDEEVIIALSGQIKRPTDPLRELLDLPVKELSPLVDDTPMHKQHGYWRQFDKPKKNRNKNL